MPPVTTHDIDNLSDLDLQCVNPLMCGNCSAQRALNLDQYDKFMRSLISDLLVDIILLTLAGKRPR